MVAPHSPIGIMGAIDKPVAMLDVSPVFASHLKHLLHFTAQRRTSICEIMRISDQC
jgi:hypothetical protein